MSEVETLRKELQGRFQVGDMVSCSNTMRAVFEVIPQVAVSDSTVLIQGETGTGKELLARAIHHLSPRGKGPFITLNCGALPDTLLESELFGYEPGAFTGALKSKPGRFALAGGGTLFLDEIGEVSPALQVRLLRVLQDRTYEPLGGTQTLKTDVRVIAATHQNLASLVQKGSFREDLFYRINVVKLELPSLRQRKEDIPLLVEHFVERFNHLQGKSIEGVSSETLIFLMAHNYPGNIRELENIIERAFVLCNSGTILPTHLPPELTAGEIPMDNPENMESAVRIVETQALYRALERNRFNRLAAAKELGIHKSTLYRKIRSLGLKLPDQDGRTRPEKTINRLPKDRVAQMRD